MMLKPKIKIPMNSLLHADDHTARLDPFDLDKVLITKHIAELATKSHPEHKLNLASVPEDLIRQIDAAYGPQGLFELVTLAMTLNEKEFHHFFDLIQFSPLPGLVVSASEEASLEPDNAHLRQSPRLANFRTNVLQPDLSRKLYRAGVHHGSLVYGLGGPRILVSHPYQGMDRYGYDIYNNSIDVVTSLQFRGFEGTFHFLDYLPGLHYKVHQVPAWVLWFSKIAVHSDLVVFVKEYQKDFGMSQRMEIDFTPDRVHKKIVEIPHEELTWAKKVEDSDVTGTIYIGPNGEMTEEEWYQMEAEHAEPFIRQYASPGFPDDRLISIAESGEIREFPLDYPMYGKQKQSGVREEPLSKKWYQFWR